MPEVDYIEFGPPRLTIETRPVVPTGSSQPTVQSRSPQSALGVRLHLCFNLAGLVVCGVCDRRIRPPDRRLAMLESGEAKSLKEIAAREGIDNSYVSRMVNLTTLAPDIVAAILDEALPNHITLFDLAVDPQALWDEQRKRVGF